MFGWSSAQVIHPILAKYFWSRSRHAEIRVTQFSYIEKKNDGRTRKWSHNTGIRAAEVVATSGLTVHIIIIIHVMAVFI